MNRKLIDLYSDYLITAFGQTSATNLARVLNHEISHDTITRFLTNKELTSRDFWKIVKPEIRRMQNPNAMIAIDDFIVEKPYSDENGVIAWFFDHVSNQHGAKPATRINVVESCDLLRRACAQPGRCRIDADAVPELGF